MWGPVELVGIIAGPVFLLFLIIIIVFLVINYHQRVYHNRQRLDMEDPSAAGNFGSVAEEGLASHRRQSQPSPLPASRVPQMWAALLRSSPSPQQL